jgi:hypothetical protein
VPILEGVSLSLGYIKRTKDVDIYFCVLFIILKISRIVLISLRNISRIRCLNRYCKNRENIEKIRIRRIRKREEDHSALINVRFVL